MLDDDPLCVLLGLGPRQAEAEVDRTVDLSACDSGKRDRGFVELFPAFGQRLSSIGLFLRQFFNLGPMPTASAFEIEDPPTDPVPWGRGPSTTRRRP